MLVLFIYAVLGMNFFGSLDLSEGRLYGAINQQASFRDFGESVILLIRCTTGEDWNEVMHDAMVDAPYLSVLYFISYQLLVGSLLLNLVIAVVLDEFTASQTMQRVRTPHCSPPSWDSNPRVLASWGCCHLLPVSCVLCVSSNHIPPCTPCAAMS